jgi:hypothetical protein
VCVEFLVEPRELLQLIAGESWINPYYESAFCFESEPLAF